MRWTPGHDSDDVIDRRGEGGGRADLGGIFGLLPLLLRFRGGWILALLLVGFVLLSGSGRLFRLTGDDGAQSGPTRGQTTTDEKKQFVGFVLDDNQKMWREIFASKGAAYKPAKLVLFSDMTTTACGAGEAATGPFYCPTDERAYIDLSFYQELEARLGAGGDFAQAYVIAHEIGHHVQNLLGTSDKVHKAGRAAQKGEDGLGVKLELQADCFAGLWAKHAENQSLLEAGDIEEALGAAAAIGDDTLQRKAGRAVQPETWTHGSSAERVRWFKTGFETGRFEACDTFRGTL